MQNGPKLPVRALPRSDIEVSGQRVVVNADGDEIAYVGFDEDAEAIALAVNMHDELVAAIREFCDRVGAGEIRSRRTYARFSAILAKLEPAR